MRKSQQSGDQKFLAKKLNVLLSLRHLLGSVELLPLLVSHVRGASNIEIRRRGILALKIDETRRVNEYSIDPRRSRGSLFTANLATR